MLYLNEVFHHSVVPIIQWLNYTMLYMSIKPSPLGNHPSFYLILPFYLINNGLMAVNDILINLGNYFALNKVI